ncbi:RNA-binding protein 2-like isoform X2 [Phalaenopsis equestris]|uniref:RNA-binding protein 2-like isoform X2 n=1 Tax=Phalaenopsis equestris TaxID=78828 RepID=UPI0009E1B7DB|nr:RNA-binding protein 2-like isoform X2 [Phalaenopsis equestris]
MDAAYWIRQPVLQSPAVPVPKRQRTNSDVVAGAPGQEAQVFMPREEHARIQAIKDTRTLGTSYDHYLQNPLSSYGSAQAGDAGVSRSVGGEVYGFRGGNASLSYQEPVMLTGPGFRSLGPQEVANGSFPMGFRSQVPIDPMARPLHPEREIPLPDDASNTLFVEGLPRDTTEREIAHIFRPFRGYKEVRVVKKEPKYDGANPIILCFVDFTTPSYAMAAMSAVEGYKMDLHDPDSWALRLQFAKFPARRAGHGSHGRR